MFEFNENEFKKYVLEKDYRTDPNYNENLDRSCELNISKREIETGAEKEIKVKQKILVCKKGCNKCKNKTDITYNLLENNCGELKQVNMIEKIKIPKGLKDGQVIILVGKGRREGDRYGNLKFNVKVK